MTYVWSNKVAMVTGANRGIGLGIVQALIARGVARIYLAGRDLAALTATAAQLANPSTELIPLQLDVTRADDIQRVAAAIDHLDVLINNAGIATGSGFVDLAHSQLAVDEMATNYFGPVNLTRALLPVMQKSPAAALVNVSSIAGIANMPLLGPYSASKAALHSFTQGVRAELVKRAKEENRQFLVQGVYPGPVETRLAEGYDMPKATPAQVAEVILSGIEQGVEDIFPDAMSQASYDTFQQNPKSLERQYAAWLG